MSDVALGVAGAVVFALTTWASLAFGYQVFANLSDEDQVADGSPESPRVATDGSGTPAPTMPSA